MFMWVESGFGTLEINQQVCRMQPGQWAFCRGCTSSVITPIKKNPFKLGCIHVIPEITGMSQQAQQPTDIFRVHHSDYNLAPPWSDRHDCQRNGIPATLQRGEFTRGSRLQRLVEYIVLFWQDGLPTCDQSQSQCELLLLKYLRSYKKVTPAHNCQKPSPRQWILSPTTLQNIWQCVISLKQPRSRTNPDATFSSTSWLHAKRLAHAATNRSGLQTFET